MASTRTTESGTADEVKMAKIGPMRAMSTTEDTTAVEAVTEVQQQHKKISLPYKLIAQLRRTLVSDYERQNVLTYALQSYPNDKRLEYMKLVEDMRIDHSWLGLLSWWNHQAHDREVPYDSIFGEKTTSEEFNGIEKVMGVARIYEPTRSDTEVVNSIMNEHMTVAYRYQYECYLYKYKIPKCLRILKLWLWDVKEGRQHPPDATEDEETRTHRVQQLLTIAHNYDGVSKFPKLGRKNRRTTHVNINNTRKRCQSPPLCRSTHGYTATKRIMIEIPDDDDAGDDDAGKGAEVVPPPPPPPLPSYEPVTPPHPPPPPYDEDNSSSSRPPRLHRQRPVDPRVHRQPVSPPSSPPQWEDAGRRMGFTSYISEHVVK